LRRRAFLIAPILAASLAVGGCLGSSEKVPPDHYYRMSVNAPDRPARNVAFPGVLSIATFDGDGLVRGRPVLFTMGDLEGTLRQHNYHYWVDSPSRLLQGQLAAYLKNSALAESVVTPDMRVRADYELVGKILRLERVLGSGPPRVAVELELSVVRLRDHKLVSTNTYQSEVNCVDDSVGAAITAMNQAVGEIFNNFVAGAGRSDIWPRG
jgi:ABC-type uncharacterized transport system auxiliary subunit